MAGAGAEQGNKGNIKTDTKFTRALCVRYEYYTQCK